MFPYSRRRLRCSKRVEQQFRAVRGFDRVAALNVWSKQPIRVFERIAQKLLGACLRHAVMAALKHHVTDLDLIYMGSPCVQRNGQFSS